KKETEVKKTEVKETEVKKTEAKKTEVKETEVKKTEAKKTEAKKTEVKDTVTKTTEVKKAEEKKIVQVSATTITKKNITKAHIETTFKHQHKTGFFTINNELALSLGFTSEEHLRTAITTFVHKHAKGKASYIDTNVWVTVFVLHYYRLVAVDHRTSWQSQYEISYRWLVTQFKSESTETEVFSIIKSFTKERYSVDEEVLKIDVQFEESFEEKKELIRSGKPTTSTARMYNTYMYKK